MNSKAVILLAGFLVAAGIFVAMNSEGLGNGEEVPLSERGEGDSRSRTNRRAVDSSGKALLFLRNVPGLDLSNAPTFAEIQRRTKDLTMEQIETLLSENDWNEGLAGWLQSALWAELGRRNDRAAFERLKLLLEGEGSESPQTQSVVFAFLRGRIDQVAGFTKGLESVSEDLNTLSMRSLPSSWQGLTMARLASKLTRLDYEAAWDFIHDSDQLALRVSELTAGFVSCSKDAAIVGFFLAVPSEELVRVYFKKWKTHLELPDVTKPYEQFDRVQDVHSSYLIFIPTPDEEVIASVAWASLVRFDPEAALGWLENSNAASLTPNPDRLDRMWENLAIFYPDRALEIFSQREYHDARAAHIGWILKNDRSLVPEAIVQTADPSHQVEILESVISSAGKFQISDGFVTPEGPNRLPNYQERYDAIREGIRLGTFGEPEKVVLLERLATEFRGVIE